MITSLRDARRHLQYAIELLGPARTAESINSEMDRPPEERATRKDDQDPPVVILRRAGASLAAVLDYLIPLVDRIEAIENRERIWIIVAGGGYAFGSFGFFAFCAILGHALSGR